MAKWMIANKKADFDGLAREFSIKNITARLIANRLITDRTKENIQCSEEAVKTYISGDISFLHNPFLMKDMEKGARIILDKIGDNKSIRVIGDYDVDGICSSYILVSGLRLFGANVDCVLPDRVKDGYGLSVKLVDEAFEAGVDTIITCDNGIAAAEQIEHAKEKGMTVVVTDHHEVPFEMGDDESKTEILPPADAVIDPKRSEGDYPFKEICGAVVAYKFLEAMSELSKESGPSDSERVEFFFQKLIFAGIATVCDVMELKDENRVIVRESLKRIPKTDNKGLKALIDVNGLDAYHMTGYNYGFVIGPCLNATGRLDLATRALSLFLEEDATEAARIAGDLKSLNDSRKDMTKNGVDEAVKFVEQEIEKGGMPKVIVLYLPEVHESIAGIIAGKIKEKYYRPTIVLTKAADGGAKGSGRSIESYDMYEELSRCKELFTKFGGHKMAAGLSLPEENIEVLRTKLNENCDLTEEDFVPVLHLDMVMPLKYIDMDLVKEFSILEPFGTGNTKPLFAQRDVSLLSGRIMGKNKNCGKYRVTDEGGKLYDMLFFGDMERWHNFLKDKYGENNVENLYSGTTDGTMKVSIAYQPDINTYQGRESIQIIMNDFT